MAASSRCKAPARRPHFPAINSTICSNLANTELHESPRHRRKRLARPGRSKRGTRNWERGTEDNPFVPRSQFRVPRLNLHLFSPFGMSPAFAWTHGAEGRGRYDPANPVRPDVAFWNCRHGKRPVAHRPAERPRRKPFHDAEPSGARSRSADSWHAPASARLRQEFFQRQGIPMPERVYEKRMLHIEAQYAVLIADAKFKTIDDARHALNQIRKLKPPPERLRDGIAVAARPDEKSAPVGEAGYVNPFLTAFVAPNPTLPPPKPATSPAESMVNLRRLNSAEVYSLFKCPGNWTLVVKSYQGASMIVSKDSEKSLIEKIGFGGDKQGDLLEASARQARQLAEILRNK